MRVHVHACVHACVCVGVGRWMGGCMRVGVYDGKRDLPDENLEE